LHETGRRRSEHEGVSFECGGLTPLYYRAEREFKLAALRAGLKRRSAPDQSGVRPPHSRETVTYLRFLEGVPYNTRLFMR
jgi:hypothetical protein